MKKNDSLKSVGFDIVSLLLMLVIMSWGLFEATGSFEGYENRKSLTMETYLSKVSYMSNDPKFLSKYNSDDTFFFTGALSGEGGSKNKTKLNIGQNKTLTIEIIGLDEEFDGELSATLTPLRTFCVNKEPAKACDEIISKVEVKYLYAYESVFNTDDMINRAKERGRVLSIGNIENITYAIDQITESDGLYFLDKEKTICLEPNSSFEEAISPDWDHTLKIRRFEKKELYSKNGLELCSYMVSVAT